MLKMNLLYLAPPSFYVPPPSFRVTRCWLFYDCWLIYISAIMGMYEYLWQQPCCGASACTACLLVCNISTIIPGVCVDSHYQPMWWKYTHCNCGFLFQQVRMCVFLVCISTLDLSSTQWRRGCVKERGKTGWKKLINILWELKPQGTHIFIFSLPERCL